MNQRCKGIIFALSTYLLIRRVNSQSEGGSKVCISKTCNTTASDIIRSLDEKYDPCTDFYNFACGSWIKNNPIPKGASRWSLFDQIQQSNQLVIKNALEQLNVTDNATSSAEVKAKNYYDACINTKTIKKLAGKPLLDIIKDLGGWYLIDSTINETKLDLQKFIQNLLTKYNINSVFEWSLESDMRNSSQIVIVLYQGNLILPTRDYYLNITAHKKILDAYVNYAIKICTLLGGNENECANEINKVISFETELANIIVPLEDQRDLDVIYNPYNIKDWQKEAPFIDWIAYFNNIFKSVNKNISPNERIIVNTPSYFKNLTKIVSEYMRTKTGQQTLLNYFMWKLSYYSSLYLSKPFRDANIIMDKALMGSGEEQERWKFCLKDTTDSLGFAVGSMFVREVFKGNDKPEAEIMINNIRDAFKRNLENLDWMDKETKKAALSKADDITNMIGYPDYILNKDELDNQYKDLMINHDDFFKNRIASNIKSLKTNLVKLGQRANRTKWEMTPSTVNAYYAPENNQIVFPAGILQLPFYDSDNPKSLNYGAIGVVMGHEITHGFDDQGRKYDSFGNLNQWWKNETLVQFNKRAECIEKQYSEYEFDGQKLNGKLTLSEDIADNGGLKTSFNAYLDYSKNTDVHWTLPGLKYNHRQLFFISFAQMWCTSITKEATISQIYTDVHSVDKYRLIASLSNSKEFAEEFNCPVGSAMNPKDKCVMW